MTMRRASTRLRRRLFGAGQHDRDRERGLASHIAHEPRLTGETPVVWTSRWLAQLRQDLRYAVRAYTRTPVLSVTVIATLALGIGANTAIFSALDAVVLRPLPVRDPEQLVELLSRYPGEPRMASFTQGAFEHSRDHNTVLSDLVAVATASVHVRTQMGASENVVGVYASGNHFSALGLRPAAGRLPGAGDDRTTVVLSWSYWQRRFGGAATVLGETMIVNELPMTVIGVGPRGFTGLQPGVTADLWMPLLAIPPRDGPPRPALQLLGRLAPGMSRERAQAELQVLDRWRVEELARSFRNPEWLKATLEVESGRAGFSPLRDLFRDPLQVVMVLVAVLLAIGCSNVGSVLLARGTSRRQEFAVRLALGAGRLRLVRQLLTESVLLALAGGALGVGLAVAGAKVLAGILTSGRPMTGLPVPLEIPIELDGRVLLFALVVSLVTGLLFGLAPAWFAVSAVPASLRETGRGAASRSGRLLGNSPLVAQIALSVVLLSITSVLVSYLRGLQSADLGFARDARLLVRLDPSDSGFSRQELADRYETLLARLAALPSVRSVTLSATTPIQGGGAARFVNVEGLVIRPEDRRYVSLNWVAPRYFETLGTPLVAGRDFARDDAGRAPVAIVNEAMARRYFGDRNPLGRRFSFDEVDRVYDIIGVVADAKYIDLHKPAPPTVYLHALQEGRGVSSDLTLHTIGPPLRVLPEVRRTVGQALDDRVRVATARTMADQMDATLVPERLMARLSVWFGVLGAMLAAIGVYGRLSYAVKRRTAEIGVRMALGATRRDVIVMVLGGAGVLVGTGLAMGLPLALLGTWLATRVLPDVQLAAVQPIATAAILMTLVALAATALPARGAARIDPVTALRRE